MVSYPHISRKTRFSLIAVRKEIKRTKDFVDLIRCNEGNILAHKSHLINSFPLIFFFTINGSESIITILTQKKTDTKAFRDSD